jgi:hypothetical protein
MLSKYCNYYLIQDCSISCDLYISLTLSHTRVLFRSLFPHCSKFSDHIMIILEYCSWKCAHICGRRSHERHICVFLNSSLRKTANINSRDKSRPRFKSVVVIVRCSCFKAYSFTWAFHVCEIWPFDPQGFISFGYRLDETVILCIIMSC